MARLTWLMRNSPKWKIDAASTAAAPPSAMPWTMCSRVPAPPEAMTGTLTASQTARSSSRSKPTLEPSRSMEVSSTSPAPRRSTSAAHSTTSTPVAVRPPLTKTSQPAPACGRHHALCAEGIGGLRQQLGTLHGGGVQADLVGAGAQQPAHIGHRAHAPADRQRDEDVLRRRRHHVVDRLAVVAGGRDVQEDQLVGTLGVVGARQLHGIAGVTQVDELHALDHTTRVDVEAGDDPGGQPFSRTGGSRAHPRATASASASVKRPAYSALPTIAASTRGCAPRSTSRSASDDTPPLAVTLTVVASATSARRSTFGPLSMPSRAMSVNTKRCTPISVKRRSASNRSPDSVVQPRALRVVPSASSPTATLSPCAATAAATNAGSSSAMVPITTREAPYPTDASRSAMLRMPPEACTATPVAWTMSAIRCRLRGSPWKAASRSTTCSHSAPSAAKRRATATGSRS